MWRRGRGLALSIHGLDNGSPCLRIGGNEIRLRLVIEHATAVSVSNSEVVKLLLTALLTESFHEKVAELSSRVVLCDLEQISFAVPDVALDGANVRVAERFHGFSRILTSLLLALLVLAEVTGEAEILYRVTHLEC